MTTQALPPLTDQELRAALLNGLAFWSRTTGMNLSPIAAEEMAVQQLATIRRACQRHAADVVRPAPSILAPRVKHWSETD